MCHLPAGIYEYFFKVEANPVEMRCQCFYSAVMANSKLDYCCKSLNNCSFRYGADELEKVKSYKYLGLIISSFGNFNLARQELKKVAPKALYKLQKEMGNHFRKNIKLTMNLFDARISPILFYASETWGIDCMVN